MLLGGALFRSAQFGFYENALGLLRGDDPHAPPPAKVLGVFDPHVVLAGFAGGFGRGMVEGPFEYVKVRRQVDAPWRLRDVYRGAGATIARNAFLFSSFVVYIDISKQLTGGEGLSPFWTGALCANAAWLTVWPMDVAKSQLQSGNFQGQNFAQLVAGAVRSGTAFRGLAPGLARSTVANGCSMVVFARVKAMLEEEDGDDEEDRQR